MGQNDGERDLPLEAQPYSRTASFTEDTVPDALLRDHTTKPGVWGVITVERGRLELTRTEAGATHVLSPGNPATVAPGEKHHVSIVGDVCFHVEFWR